ncbi:MAG: 3-deoxy-D-manno-octulosonic acid transferase [Planctomycetota bacterium]|jgi:3-deoxy-D-manno-octulosonic-acid transferase
MSFLDIGYAAAGLIASPWLLFKMATDRRYRHRLGERFGAPPPLDGPSPRVWFHAASVGETALLKPLVAELRRRRPGVRIAVSTLTIAGRENAKKLFPDAPVFYLPFDLTFAVRRAFRRVLPDAVVLVELEVWPNFTKVAKKRGVPLVVVNGRISDRSFRRYRRMKCFFRPSFRRLSAVGAQSEAVAERMRELGAADPQVTGNLKYDLAGVADPEAERRRWLETFGWPEDAPVLFGGSTHDPEERILVEAVRRLRASVPGLRLVIAPRHLERVADVEKIVEGAEGRCYKKSQLPGGKTAGETVILDTVGELSRAYALATVVFIGGTFGPRGGQNMLEPAVVGKPILSGPSLHNFRDVARALADAGGMRVLERPEDLGPAVGDLLGDPGRIRSMGESARRVAASGRGAVKKSVDLIESVFGTGGDDGA